MTEESRTVSIAVVGMGCRLPGATGGAEGLWSMISEGRHGYSPTVPADRFTWSSFYHPDSDMRGGTNFPGGHFLDQAISALDERFFGIPPLEAAAMDPQQRLLLETCWEAVENAGLPLERFCGTDTGVFAAMFAHDYEQLVSRDPMSVTPYHNIGVSRCLLSNRVSYVFNLHGPSLTLDTGCSGSLVAVNLACASLRSGETSMALAGGVSLMFSPVQLAMMTPTGLFNEQGRCFSFDERGHGYGRAEGVGVVLLKRLEDALRDGDSIRSIIRSSGANQDGRTNGITLPSATAQAALARKLLRDAGFRPGDVQYVEAHGTGTVAGDKLEIQAIAEVMAAPETGRREEHPLYVGTSKPNVGHSEAASGSTGLIKTVLAMEKGMLPPQILLETLKPELELDRRKIKLARSLMPWPDWGNGSTRKAVVNCFGSGGTNAMLALEFPYQSANGMCKMTNGDSVGNHDNPDQELFMLRLFLLSARSEYSLIHWARDLKTYLQQKLSSGESGTCIEQLSHTLAHHRSQFPWRLGILASDMDSLVTQLDSLGSEDTKLKPMRGPGGTQADILVFTGQGSQYPQMGDHLLTLAPESEFARSIRKSDALLKILGAQWSLVDELGKEKRASRLNDSKIGQPATTAVQVALVDQLKKEWQIRPAAVVGHSSGEIAAAYAAGALTHEAAIRVAYERSFLAEASRERLAKSHSMKEPVRGAMMAVGLGEEDINERIAQLDFLVSGSTHNEGTHNPSGQIVVACVNSPSSTTVSGDTLAIGLLKDSLDSSGIFARLLKVDTAYHSHHMKAVGPDYLKRLEGVKAGSVSSSRFFSSVTGTEKHDSFGAAYWVENLVSPVRFSDTLMALAQDSELGGFSSLNIIEVGPHKALAGPIRQTLAQLGRLSYRYIPTLIRHENSHSCLMQTASDLFRYEGGTGSRLDMRKVVSMGLLSPSPQKKLHDLPPYHWDHSSHLWSESRLSKAYRLRRHPHHDLLGLRDPSSPESAPSWRLILTLDTLPWLRDHVVDGFVIFPASGYMAMAIEAVKQLHQDQAANQASPTRITRYHLRNVSFVRSLPISEDTNNDGVEVLLTLRLLRNRMSFTFTVHSASEDKGWQVHCSGEITTRLDAETVPDEVGGGYEAELSRKSHLESLARARTSCRQAVRPSAMYVQLASAGNHYGPSFAAVDNVRLSDISSGDDDKTAGMTTSTSLSTVVIPDTTAMMPGRFAQSHVIHPTSLDALLHTCLVLFHLTPEYSRAGKGSAMPISLGEIDISADIVSEPGQQLQIVSSLRTTSGSSANFDIVAFQETEFEQQPVVTLSNGEVRVVGQGSDTQSDEKAESDCHNIFRAEWGLDMSSVTGASLESVTIPLQSTKAGLTPEEKTAALDLACIRWIDWSLAELEQARIIVKDDYRTSLLSWMTSLFDCPSSPGRKALEASKSQSREQVLSELASLGVEGELVAHLGPQLTAVLTGTVDPLSLFLEDNLLYRVYNGDDTLRGNRYLADYVRNFAFQRRGAGLRILEIGAGTAGATLPLLKQCSPDGAEAFCDEYVFTDISPGFFETARDVTLKQWAHMITFKTLDLERDPMDQGFDVHGYDLVLASNVIHATVDLGRSLGHIHRLLKPGGVLGMVELVELTPFHNMTFGMLPGWWAGVNDGRTRGPLQSAEQWDSRLRNAHFSGVDLVAYDFPFPARHCAFITSTAEAKNAAAGIMSRRDSVISVSSGQVDILNALSERHPDAAKLESICKRLGEYLRDKAGFQIQRRKWSDDLVDEASTYVLIDSAQQPLLAHASTAQLRHVTSLLIKGVKLYWITFDTSGNQSYDHQVDAVSANAVSISPEHGMAVGLSRSARSENESLMFFTMDVRDRVSNKVLQKVSDLILSCEEKQTRGQTEGLDFEYKLQGGELHIQRLVSHPSLNRAAQSSYSQQEDHESESAFYQPNHRLKIHVERPGILSSLTFIHEDDSVPNMDLEPDQVQLEAHAWGVNFHDVYVALGQMKGTAKNPVVTMGGECAGIIKQVGSNFTSHFQPGDRVAVLTGVDAPYGSRTRVNGHLAYIIPDHLSFAEAASIPVAFGTAIYSLVDCAHLQPEQTVLIHAATGGLGQAAVMLAQCIGATIFATVSSDAKRQLLMDRYGLPKSHIFGSRTTDFAVGVMRLTKGCGVDVVLNSTSGETADASWRCVAELGTFVEVGKTDIYAHSTLSMEPFNRNARFVGVDLKAVSKARPKTVQGLLGRVFSYFQPGSAAEGRFSPLPITTFPIGELEQAFRFMTTRKHTGKLVLVADQDTTVKARLPPKYGVGSANLRGDGTYIIAGGLGNLGKRLCRHLQKRGARRVVLFSRKMLDEAERKAIEVELAEHPGSAIRIITCDVADPSHMTRAAKQLADTWPPIRGVIQAAMVLSDRTLSQMTIDHFQASLQPKYAGTRNLIDAFAATRTNSKPGLDFFVMLSSVASVLGLRGQSNYAAGNAYQDALAQRHAASNFVTINLPLIRETAITLPPESRGIVSRQGAQVIDMDEFLAVMDYAMSGAAASNGCAQITYGVSASSLRERAENGLRIHPLLRHIFARGRVPSAAEQDEGGSGGGGASIALMITRAGDTTQAEALVLEALRDKVAALTAGDVGEMGVDVPISELGLDSLVSIELKNFIGKVLRAAVVTADIMDSPNLRSLATFVAQRSALTAPNQNKGTTADVRAEEVNGVSNGLGHAGYLAS